MIREKNKDSRISGTIKDSLNRYNKTLPVELDESIKILSEGVCKMRPT